MPRSLQLLFMSAVIAGCCPCNAWEGPTNITAEAAPSGDHTRPEITADSSGAIHLLWVGGNQASIYHQVRAPGGPWSEPEVVGGVDVQWVRAASDAIGSVHVAWSEVSGEIRHRRWSAGVWAGATANVSRSPGVSAFPAIACAPDGRVYIAWQETVPDGGAHAEIVMSVLEASGWCEYSRLTNSPAFDGLPAIAVDAGGTLHVSWVRGHDIYYNSTVHNGSWNEAAAIDVSLSAGVSTLPSLAISESGIVHLVWEDETTGNWEIYYRCRSADWLSTENLSKNAATADGGAAVAVGADGGVSVIWQDSSNVYFSRTRECDPFHAWTSIYVAPIVDHTRLCVDPGMDIHLVWEGRSPTQRDIIYAAHAYPDVTPPPQVLQFRAQGSSASVFLDWENPDDLDFLGTMIRASTDAYPEEASEGQLVADMPGQRSAQQSFRHEGIIPDATYYYSAFSYDAERNYSAGARAWASTKPLSCSQIKQMPDGMMVEMSEKVVSAIFPQDGAVYVCDPDRAGGIRVEHSTGGFQVGDAVSVSGKSATIVINGHPSERYVRFATITKTGFAGAPRPFAMTCGHIGGGSAGDLAPGVRDGQGLNNIGLPVRMAGSVTWASPTSPVVFVDDGSGVPNVRGLATPVTGVMVKGPSTGHGLAAGDPVVVTGIIRGNIPPGWTENGAFVQTPAWEPL